MYLTKKIFLPVILCLDGLFLTLSIIYSNYFFLFSMLMMFVSMFPILRNFERRSVQAEEVILIAVLSALGAIARVPFSSLPSVQPTSFIIIMTGIVFGGETGFLVGALSALASNLLLGQGPWTPWQMFAWSLMGLTSGLFSQKAFIKISLSIKIFGFCWGFLFGWIMNLWSVFAFFSEISLPLLLSSAITSFYFDLLHALSNIFFLSIFSTSWLKILNRIKRKYGLLQK